MSLGPQEDRPADPVPLCRSLGLLLALLALLAAGAPARAQGRVPAGFAWCAGIADAGDLPLCRSAGFDAIRLDVPWTERPAWDGIDRAITAAQAADLKVVLALQTAAPPEGVGPVDPDSGEYAARLRLWVQFVADHFHGNPAVAAWMVADEPEVALHVSDLGFRTFVAARYKDPATLSQAWRGKFDNFGQVSVQVALFAGRTAALGINGAGTDLALYQRQLYVHTMQLWAKALRQAEPGRPLLTGVMARYRCLISVPEEYDAVVAHVAAGRLRGLDSPAEAVAIARRCGRMGVIASISAQDLLGGLGSAFLQGATGIAVEDWQWLRAHPEEQARLAAALAAWRKSGGPNDIPLPTVRILYEPFGESAPLPSAAFTGWLTGYDNGDLAPLFAAFRQGTCFGQVGYLAQEDLNEQGLAGCRVLLCPMALSLTPDQVRTLFHFAEGGGVVVADAGLGCYEVGGILPAWSADLGMLLGVKMFWPAAPGDGFLRVYDKAAPFLSLSAGDRSMPIQGQDAFKDPAVLMEPTDGTTPLAAVVDRTVAGKKLFGGLLVHPIGRGWVVYASMKLWQRWSPDDPLFLLFHRDLVSRTPAVTLRDMPLIGGDVQVAAFERGLVMRNTGERALLATADLPGDRLYAGNCLNVCGPATEQGVQVVGGLSAGAIGLYEQTPIRCVLEQGMATVSVESYGPEGIRLAVCAGRPQISLDARGMAVMRPSLPQKGRILIGDGRYHLAPGSLHLLRAEDLDAKTTWDMRVQADADGHIEIVKTFYCDAITLTPLPK